MKPIKISKESLNINNIEELEYKYLVEIPQNIIDKYKKYMEESRYSEENKRLELFLDNGFEIFKFIGVVGDSNLFVSENRLYKAELDTDFMFHDRGYEDWGFVLNDEVIKNMEGKELMIGFEAHTWITEIFEKYEGKELDIGDLIQKILGYKLKRENLNRKIEEKRKTQEELIIKGNEDEKTDFNNEGKWRKDDINVYGINNIIFYKGKEYTFKKDINKIFTIEELNNSYRQYNVYGADKLDWVESLCVLKEVNYNFMSKNKKRNYEVKFKKGKMYVDNVCVPKNRSVFFISRANGDTEKLKILKELSAVKVEFLGLTNISLNTSSYNYNIPIEIKYIDKIWEVTLLDKTLRADWKELEIFRYNIQSLKTNFYTDDIPILMVNFGISKAELFDYMKKIQILDKLGETDEDD